MDYTVEFASKLEAQGPIFDRILRPRKIDPFNDEATYEMSVSFEAGAGNVIIRESYILTQDLELRLGAHFILEHDAYNWQERHRDDGSFSLGLTLTKPGKLMHVNTSVKAITRSPS